MSTEKAAQRHVWAQHWPVCVNCGVEGIEDDSECCAGPDPAAEGNRPEPAPQGWIPTSESVPTGDHDVLVTIESDPDGYRYVSIDSFRAGGRGWGRTWKIIAWRELLDPYKGAK